MQSTLRITIPFRMQQLWDCFGHSTSSSTLDLEKFTNVAAALHKIPRDEVSDDLESAIKDGLIVAEMIQEKGNEIEIYKLPEFPINKGDHDWYCFRCHLGGPVLKCEDCPRVFHIECLPEDRKPHKDLFVCPVCHLLSTKPSSDKMVIKNKQLNVMITYICDRFREWQVEVLNKADGKIWATHISRPPKETWRFDALVYTPIDLTIMYEKALSSNYKCLEEFQVDCEGLFHAIGTYFGTDSTKGSSIGAAFFKDVMHDIQEVLLCHDCFRLSNEKNHPWWFCLPCSVPHEVVFAKQTGYPFWPAKVMKQDGNKYDVRYFGGNYERAIIDSKNILPIDTPISQLKIRKNANWNEAFDELQKFQDIAKNPDLVNSLPAKNAKSTPAKPTKTGVKRPASEPASKVAEKKPRREMATPTARVARASTANTNGISSEPQARKPGRPSAAASKITVTKRESVSSTPVQSQVAAKRSEVRRIVTDDQFVVPETVDEIDDCLASVFKNAKTDSSGGVNYSDEEEDKVADDKEDAVSSSVNEFVATRNAYVQTNPESTIPADVKERFRSLIMNMKNAMEKTHARDLSNIKKKQWCYNCEKEAIYHCCWNTAYCSTECQQQHWTKDHKKHCRRIRHPPATSTAGTPNSTTTSTTA